MARADRFAVQGGMASRTVLSSLAMLAIALIHVADAPAADAQDAPQDASPWETVPHGFARLIAGATHESTDGIWLRAGVEIHLDPGWHTYWRYPVDSGVPPTFDFGGSENVKSVIMLWPAPAVFDDGLGGHSIGYIEHVTFPLPSR